ncbi:hypothetical protein NDO75_00740 [Natrinema sp. 1APR25-10V2]|nr:hypothetical protein [Natrinema sp. 1APR25-10V2]
MASPGTYNGECHHLYTTDENRSMSAAVLDTIAEHQDIDLMEADFCLYDIIDPSALNRLFQLNPDGAAGVSFAVGESYVTLRDIGSGVEIWVSDFPYD